MKFAILSVKFLPIIMTVLLASQCFLALIDVDISNQISTIYGHSLLYNSTLLILSRAFHFCFWHRVIIINLIAINLIEWIDRNIFAFNPLEYVWMLIILLLASSLLAAILYSRYGCFKRNIKEAY